TLRSTGHSSFPTRRSSDLLSDAGLPRGVVNIVTGFGPQVGGPLTEHPEVRAISLTGSTAVGRIVGTSAAKSFKHCSLELGGKNRSEEHTSELQSLRHLVCR